MGRILITGASSGLGREIAISLSEEHDLILNARNERALEETASRCGARDVRLWPYDLSEIDGAAESLKRRLADDDAAVSGFVHCAGSISITPCRSISPDRLREIFAVNVFSAALLVQVLASRRANGSALRSVVFISSNISNRGASAFSIYGASKAALDGLMRSLAVELAPQVRVNSILPGGMETSMTSDIFRDEELRGSFEKNSPLGIGSPSQIAPMVRFLLSPSASWITGQQITIDGGRTIDITERG